MGEEGGYRGSDPARFWVERNDFRRDRGPFTKGSFRWFSITNSPSPGHKRHFVGYQPKRAIKYVRKHKGLRLQLTEVSVEGGRAGRAENACRLRHVTRASGDNPAPSEKPVDDFCP